MLFRSRDSRRDTLKLSWVKQQQKLAKERKRLKRLRKKTKIVVLQINSEKLKALEDEWKAKKAITPTATQVSIIEVGDDLVTTDLILNPVKKPETQGQNQPITENTLKSDSPLKPRKRVAPGWVEISDEDTDQSSTTPDVMGAYDREDGEYRGWGARQFPKGRQAVTTPLKRNRRVVSRNEKLEEASIKSNISEESHITAFHAPNVETTDHYFTVAHQRIEHELAVDEDAKKTAEGEIAAGLNLQAKAEQAQKSEEEEKHNALQLEMEQERKRKEQVAKAYRESKLCALKAAAGEDPFEIWDGFCDDLEDAEELPPLPVSSDFAVVINVPGLLDRGLYKPFFNSENNNFSVNPSPNIDLNVPTQVPNPKSSPLLIRNKRHGRAIRPTEGSSMTCSPALSITRTKFPRKSRPRKPEEDDTYRNRRLCQPRSQKQAVHVNDEFAHLPKRKRPRSVSSTCPKSPTGSKLHPTETDLPTTPSRVSSRKRKMLLQSYNFDTDEECHVTRSANISREIPDIIDLELDPDLGVLERERVRQARLKEREDQQKRSQHTMRIDSDTFGSHVQDQEIEEQLDMEDEYNSRWRRRTERW